MKIRMILIVVLALLVGAGAATAQEDPCRKPQAGEALKVYVQRLSKEVSDAFNAEHVAQEQIETEAADRANEDGLDGGRLDLLRRLFVALGLGVVDDEADKLVFNFNSEALKLSPRVIVHDPVLFAPFAEEVEEDVDKDALKNGIGDLDDVELRLRWTNASGRPKTLIEKLDDVAAEQFKAAYLAGAQEQFRSLGESDAETRVAIGKELAAAGKLLGTAAETPVQVICEVPAARRLLRELVDNVRSTGTAALEDLRTSLDEQLFFDLADLIDGQPKLTAEGAYRRREGAAGPDEYSLSLRFEIGKTSYWGWQKWAKRRGRAQDAESAQDYLREKGMDSAPMVSLTADYVNTDNFHFLPGEGGAAFDHPKSHKTAIKGNASWYLGGARDQRLVFEGSYDDVTDDPQRQDRWLGTLSWVAGLEGELAQLAGGSELVVSLVWAEKPEFLGEVDKELGMRAGLKWSFNGD